MISDEEFNTTIIQVSVFLKNAFRASMEEAGLDDAKIDSIVESVAAKLAIAAQEEEDRLNSAEDTEEN